MSPVTHDRASHLDCVDDAALEAKWSVPRCAECSQPLKIDDAYCPHCGAWDGVRGEPEPTMAWDYVAAIVMASAALALTAPSLEGFHRSLGGLRFPSAMFFAAWHAYVWGIPIAVTVDRWRRNMLHHRPAAEQLATLYVRAQFAVLISAPIVAVMALVALRMLYLE
jgi:hypothetical protein